LAAILPFSESERAFLDLLLDRGEIDSTIVYASSRRGIVMSCREKMERFMQKNWLVTMWMPIRRKLNFNANQK
jgi:hypothetical protein